MSAITSKIISNSVRSETLKNAANVIRIMETSSLKPVFHASLLLIGINIIRLISMIV